MFRPNWVIAMIEEADSKEPRWTDACKSHSISVHKQVRRQFDSFWSAVLVLGAIMQCSC